MLQDGAEHNTSHHTCASSMRMSLHPPEVVLDFTLWLFTLGSCFHCCCYWCWLDEAIQRCTLCQAAAILDCQGHSRLWDGSGWLQPWGKFKLHSGAGNESGTSTMGRYKRGLILWRQNSLQWTRVVLATREMGALQWLSISAEEGAVTPIILSSLIWCCAAPSQTVMKTTSLN